MILRFKPAHLAVHNAIRIDSAENSRSCATIQLIEDSLYSAWSIMCVDVVICVCLGWQAESPIAVRRPISNTTAIASDGELF